ncbi:unnamed protein product [Boreogadus saida]
MQVNGAFQRIDKSRVIIAYIEAPPVNNCSQGRYASPFGRGLGAKGECDSNENLVGRSVRPQVGHQWRSGATVVFSPFPQLSDSGLDAELRQGVPRGRCPPLLGKLMISRWAVLLASTTEEEHK